VDAALVLLAGVEVVSVVAAGGPHRGWVAALSGASALVLLGRRRSPLAACVTAFAALALSMTWDAHITTPQFFGVLVTFAVSGAVAARRDAVLAWGAGAAVIAWSEWRHPSPGAVGDYLLTLAFASTMWGAGLLVAARAQSASAAAERADHAERDRQQHAVRAVGEERARIARELHDVVSHGLSVVVLQTLAARAALEDGHGAAAADRHLDAVESSAREALGEMRRMLGLLQPDELDADAPAPPTPGLRDVPHLLRRAGAAGLQVTSAELPEGVELPGGLDLAVHRIVQEALTNAVKHAPGADVAVAVRVDPAAVAVTVTNGPARDPGATLPGAGHGLIGMRQRVEVYGGTLTAAPTPGGGFTVAAVLPREDGRVPPPRPAVGSRTTA
jgi:signal transduction histidine kinase